MSLDELLALLPDNTTGQISAADMRTIVSELYQAAHTAAQPFAFRYSTTSPPTAGRVALDNGWQASSVILRVAEVADDGTALSFAVLDSAATGRCWLTTATGETLHADVTGPSSDLGTYRELPIAVRSIEGATPANNAQLTLTFGAVFE